MAMLQVLNNLQFEVNADLVSNLDAMGTCFANATGSSKEWQMISVNASTFGIGYTLRKGTK